MSYVRAAAFYNNDKQYGIGVTFEGVSADAVMNAAIKAVKEYPHDDESVSLMLRQLRFMSKQRKNTGSIAGAIGDLDEKSLAIHAFLNIFVLEAWGYIKANEYNGCIAAQQQ